MTCPQNARIALAAPIGLDAYVAVVDAGSIAEAARELGVPRPTLSRQLKRLEHDLGVQLLHRSTRRLALTPAGEELHRRARHIVAETRAAEAALRDLEGGPHGDLRISLPSSPAASVFGEAIAQFAALYPRVRLAVTSTNRHVDLLAEGIDVALRGGVVRDETLMQRVLSRGEVWAVASPTYLDRRGRPVHPDALAGHSCLVGFAGTQRPEQRWPLFHGGQVPVNPTHASDDLQVLRALALNHLGIALAPGQVVVDDVRAGRLERVLPGVVGRKVGISVVYLAQDPLPQRVRAFVDHLVAWAGTNELLRDESAASAWAPPAD